MSSDGRAGRPSSTGPGLDWPVTSRVGPGLAGAITGATRVSAVDGEQGRLELRGVPIEVLAERATFEDVACLLIGSLRQSDDASAWRDLRDRLRDGRGLHPDAVAIVRSLPAATHPMRLLRAGVSALGCFELAPGEDAAGVRHWGALRIVGQVAALAGVVLRHRRSRPPLDIGAGSSFAGALAAALTDARPDDEAVDALDLCLVLYADNGMDAPTFTSMVVGSALADPYYNVVAGLSALRGPRVGGSGETLLRELLPLADAAAARAWVARRLAAGAKIPGFGHRMFRVPDPRVAIARERAGRLASHVGDHRLLDVVHAVEEAATERLGPRKIHVNVNLYTAVIFHLLGAEPEMAPCLVAVGRMAGLVARVREYLAESRLFRPLSRYIGPAERPFVPLEQR